MRISSGKELFESCIRLSSRRSLFGRMGVYFFLGSVACLSMNITVGIFTFFALAILMFVLFIYFHEKLHVVLDEGRRMFAKLEEIGPKGGK